MRTRECLTSAAATGMEVALAAFSPLLDVLADVPDPRRAEGKLYKLPHVLLFAILAIVTGCNSYGSGRPRTPLSATSSKGSTRLRWRWFSVATLPCCRRHAPHRDRAASRSMARRCAAALTSSTTAVPPRCSARSPPTPRWCSRTSTSREVQRDPGGAGLAGRTRPRPGRHRHVRRNALPKKLCRQS